MHIGNHKSPIIKKKNQREITDPARHVWDAPQIELPNNTDKSSEKVHINRNGGRTYGNQPKQ